MSAKLDLFKKTFSIDGLYIKLSGVKDGKYAINQLNFNFDEAAAPKVKLRDNEGAELLPVHFYHSDDTQVENEAVIGSAAATLKDALPEIVSFTVTGEVVTRIASAPVIDKEKTKRVTPDEKMYMNRG